MKKLSILAVLLGLAIGGFAQQETKGLAKANKVNNVYVFSYCEPVKEFDVVGTKKMYFSWTGSFDEVAKRLSSKALRTYPDADGILVSEALFCYKAQVIRYKK